MHPLQGLRLDVIPGLIQALLKEPPQELDNFATYRYGFKPTINPNYHARWYRYTVEQLARFQQTWTMLEDDLSKAILAECLVHNCLGWRHHRRTQNSTAYQQFIAQLTAGHPDYPIEKAQVKPIRHKWMNLHHIPAADLRVIATDGFFINVLFLKQYGMERPGVPACVAPGDVVIDCGAGTGDTTMWLAHLAGPDGRVLGYEFSPGNIELFKQNLALNPTVAPRVQLVPHPTGAKSGEIVRFGDNATGSRIGRGAAHEASTLSIDDLVEREQLDRVDLIKMDIESSEGDALKGAKRTISRFRPKLAICAYHRLDDLWVLPQLIRMLNPTYRLFLDHHTIHTEESVLYAFPK